MAKIKVKQIEADTHLVMGNTYTGDMYRIERLGNPVQPYDAVNLRSLENYTGLTQALSGLTDVIISNPEYDQILVYSGGTWYNKNNDGSGVTHLSQLSDVDIGSLSEYQFLTYSGGTWVNTTDISLESGSYIYSGEWRLFEQGGNFRVEKFSGGTWVLGGEFFV